MNPFPRIFRRGSPTVSAALALVLPASGLPVSNPAFAQVAERPQITLSPERSRISIVAAGVPRGQVLEALRSGYHIEVRPFAAPNERITVRLTDLSVDSAIALVMPVGSHYTVRLGEGEIVRPAASAHAKRGPREVRPGGLHAKTATPLRHPTGTRFKVPPERSREPTPREGPGLKPLPRPAQTVIPGQGPKVPRRQPPSRDSTVRLTFIIRAPDTVTISSARLIEGRAAESSMVRGPFLFALRDVGGATLRFGAIEDPLEEHSYQTDGTHSAGRAQEGTFGISLPAELMRGSRLASLRLEFYDARSVTLPPSLDAQSFRRAQERAKSITRISGTVLARAVQQGRPR